MTTKVPELFGSMVFNDEVMKERLPKDIYKALHKTMDEGLHLQLLRLDGGEVLVDGTVDALTYEDSQPAGSFLARLFG